MDQRSYTILQYLAKNPLTSGKELEETFDLTRKQLSYSFEKVNDYLEQNGHSAIRRLKTGRFVIPSSVSAEFGLDAEEITQTDYYYSDEERTDWIILRLLCHDTELSVFHFTDELEISKNTFMNDLKKVQEIAEANGLDVKYNRKEGYRLLGEEYGKRSLLVATLRRILDSPGGDGRVARFYKIAEDNIRELFHDMEGVEQQLRIRFTDDRLRELPYILYFMLMRVHYGKQLQHLPEAAYLVLGTEEYSIMSRFIEKYRVENELERIYFTTQIQISNVNSFLSEGESRSQILKAGQTLLDKFQSVSCVRLKCREEFLEALVLHLRPALYRIRYHYHVQPDISSMVLPKYQYLHEMVKMSCSPFEELLGQAIPEKEMVYITILFAAWLQKEGTLEAVSGKKKAIVICTNGITVSSYIFVTLKELLPELEFIDHLSEREFYTYDREFHIVFTTVKLDTDKIQFMVQPFVNQQSGKAFRRKVMERLGKGNLDAVDIKGLVEIIENHADIHERDQLIKSLNLYLNGFLPETGIHTGASPDPYVLERLLTEDTVKILEDSKNWKEVIRIASMPLLKNQSIEPRYVDKMIEFIETEKPYIMLADGVVVAHAGVDDGVKDVGMSLLRLPARICIGGYMDADIIIVLSAPDKNRHLSALYQLLNILDDNVLMQEVRLAQWESQIVDLLRRREKKD